MIKINSSKCDGCGDCADICPAEVYEMKGKKAEVKNAEGCIECCSCVEVCQKNAVTNDSC